MVTTFPDMKFHIEEVAGHMPERMRWELVNGELHMMTPAGGEHGQRAVRIIVLLDEYARRTGSGSVLTSETGFILQRNPDTLRAPDAAFIKADRADRIGEGFIEGPPDLAVEVVSPSENRAQVLAKAQHWLDAGAEAVWLIWPRDRGMTVLTPNQPPRQLGESDTLSGEPVLPGFRCTVSDIFA